MGQSFKIKTILSLEDCLLFILRFDSNIVVATPQIILEKTVFDGDLVDGYAVNTHPPRTLFFKGLGGLELQGLMLSRIKPLSSGSFTLFMQLLFFLKICIRFSISYIMYWFY